MAMSQSREMDAPTIMRIGAARLTAGLDRMPRLDLDAHRDVFGPLPRLSAADLISMAEQVDLRGQGGAAFPFARKVKAVIDTAEANDCPTIVVVNATEGEPGSVKDKMLMIRSPYLILSGAALAAWSRCRSVSSPVSRALLSAGSTASAPSRPAVRSSLATPVWTTCRRCSPTRRRSRNWLCWRYSDRNGMPRSEPRRSRVPCC
jgi:hypothetical protein